MHSKKKKSKSKLKNRKRPKKIRFSNYYVACPNKNVSYLFLIIYTNAFFN